MDFHGLSDKTDFTFLYDYDFVYLYVLPVDKVGKYWWYEIPNVVSPYCKKLVLQFDYEGIMYDLPPFVKNVIDDCVDVLCYNSPNAGKRWKVKCPKYPLMMLPPPKELLKLVAPLPKEMREGIGVLLHAGTGCSATLSVTLCNRLPYKTMLFSAWLGMTEEQLKQYYNGPNMVHFPFMEYRKYLDLLRTCYVVLEDNENYHGFSRLSYECATLGIPVVGSTNSMGCNLFYPHTTTNPQNLQLQTQLIKRLYQDNVFYHGITGYARSMAFKYFSDEWCLSRFIQILTELGFSV